MCVLVLCAVCSVVMHYWYENMHYDMDTVCTYADAFTLYTSAWQAPHKTQMPKWQNHFPLPLPRAHTLPAQAVELSNITKFFSLSLSVLSLFSL